MPDQRAQCPSQLRMQTLLLCMPLIVDVLHPEHKQCNNLIWQHLTAAAGQQSPVCHAVENRHACCCIDTMQCELDISQPCMQGTKLSTTQLHPGQQARFDDLL